MGFRKQKRTVRFADEMEQFSAPSGRVLTTKEKVRSWFQRSEYEAIKFEAWTTGETIQKLQRRHSTNPLTYTNVHTRAYTSCHVRDGPSAMELEQLAHWVKTTPSRRGLDRHTMKDLSEARIQRVKAHRDTVMRLQHCAILENMKPKDVTNIIQVTSTRMTKPERVFARAMAAADALATRDCDKEESTETTAFVREAAARISEPLAPSSKQFRQVIPCSHVPKFNGRLTTTTYCF